MGMWVFIIIVGAVLSVAVQEVASHFWRKTRLARTLAERRLQRALREAADRPIDPVERDRESGTLSLHQGILSYSHLGSEIWSTNVADCRLIGERTTACGPFADDWFIVIFAGDPVLRFDAPVYANPGIHGLLSDDLGIDLAPQLTRSTSLHSAIVWPPDLEGRALFDYEPAPRGRNPISRVMDWFAPLATERLSEDTRRFLRVESDDST